jgi:selenide,water dikinase
MEAYAEILKGGFDMAAEAGLRIIGGHTIDDFPPKYGLAVVGYVHPDRIVTNSGARPGDLLVLTKPVGTGVILAGQRMKMASEDDVVLAKKNMKTLNRTGAEVMKKFEIRGGTDITGFGLAGHALKMAKASNVSIELDPGKVPLIGETYRLVDEGCIPGASFRNLDFVENDMHSEADLDYNLKMITMDAQTSGGLLMCVPPGISGQVITELHNAGLTQSAVIGKVTEKKNKYLYLNS